LESEQPERNYALMTHLRVETRPSSTDDYAIYN
jgi:hypothetical protein